MTKEKKKSGCGTWLWIILILGMIGSCFGNDEENNNTYEQKPKTSHEETKQEQNNSTDNHHFKLAVESIGMDFSNVKNIDKLDDWASGKRYSFVYDGFRYIVYELDNGEISTINTEFKRTPIYERGYEPLNYKDFEPDQDVVSNIQTDALHQMTNYISGATSLNVVSGSMMYDRIYNYYSISGEVKAKNDTNKEIYTFTADYNVNENSFECIYLAIDGKNYIGTENCEPAIEKIEIKDNSDNTSSIVLSDGKQGQYGKYDLFDGEEYLRYHVPSGNYKVKCIVGGGFYIETIELHKEDGYDTATTIKQVDIKSGDVVEIDIEEGQCISLYLNTEIELCK